ncbi:uncharacterized protein LOC135844296 [Planococcus citri]|uniref:uncharacterized protein LOC135844296 n=1 Tax=Planococcus citri TaxID=170843 RepID=UPI0031FA04D8
MKLLSILLLLCCSCVPAFVRFKTAEQNDSEAPLKNSPEPKPISQDVIINPKPEKLEKKSKNPPAPPSPFYPALELIRKKDKTFCIRRDFIPMAETRDVSKLVYFCPAESYDEHKRSKNMMMYRYCLYLNEISSGALSSVDCTYDPQPKLWFYEDEDSDCGRDGRGTLYRFIHEICWQEKSFLKGVSKVKKKRDKNSKMRHETVEVYLVCLEEERELLYLKYDLIAASKEEYWNTQTSNLVLQSKTEGFVEFDFEQVTQLFKPNIQEKKLKKLFGKKFDDVLIPQMLISPKHIKPRIAGNSLQSYLNIRPLWKSVRKNWRHLEKRLWKLGFEYPQDIRIYAGTYDYDKISNDGKKSYSIKMDSTTELRIPFIWWKLIVHTKNKEGIILAVQNQSESSSNGGQKLCPESICDSHGWPEISEFGYCCEFGEEKRKLLHLNEEEIKIYRVFNPTKHVSGIKKWVKNLFKMK